MSETNSEVKFFEEGGKHYWKELDQDGSTIRVSTGFSSRAEAEADRNQLGGVPESTATPGEAPLPETEPSQPSQPEPEAPAPADSETTPTPEAEA